MRPAINNTISCGVDAHVGGGGGKRLPDFSGVSAAGEPGAGVISGLYR